MRGHECMRHRAKNVRILAKPNITERNPVIGIKSPHHPYVKLYTVSTPEWSLLPWHAKLLYPALLRHLLENGSMPLFGKDPVQAVSDATSVPPAFVAKALPVLMNETCPWFLLRDDALWAVDYEKVVPVEVTERPFGKWTPATSPEERFSQQLKRKHKKIDIMSSKHQEVIPLIPTGMMTCPDKIYEKSAKTKLVIPLELSKKTTATPTKQTGNVITNFSYRQNHENMLRVAPPRTPPENTSEKTLSYMTDVRHQKDNNECTQYSGKSSPRDFRYINFLNVKDFETTKTDNRVNKKHRKQFSGPSSAQMEVLIIELTRARQAVRPSLRGPTLIERNKALIQKTWDLDPTRYKENPEEFVEDWKAAIWSQAQNVARNPQETLQYLTLETLCRPGNFLRQCQSGRGNPDVTDFRMKGLPRPMRSVVVEYGPLCDEEWSLEERLLLYAEEIYKKKLSHQELQFIFGSCLKPWARAVTSIPKDTRTIKDELKEASLHLPKELPQTPLEPTCATDKPSQDKCHELAHSFLASIKQRASSVAH